MIKNMTVNVQTEIISEVYCDMCKKRIHTELDPLHEDYIHIEKRWGYGSKNDGQDVSVDICENCWEKIEQLIGKEK